MCVRRLGGVIVLVAFVVGLLGACEPGPPPTPHEIDPNANIPTFVAQPKPSTSADTVPTVVPAAAAPAATAGAAPNSQATSAGKDGSVATAAPRGRSNSSVAPQGMSCPPDKPVKGVIDEQTGEKTFYTEQSTAYGQLKPDECFATEQEATAAGYHAAREQ